MASAGNVQYSAVNTTQPEEEEEQAPPPYDEKQNAPPQFDQNALTTKPLVHQQPPQQNVIPQQQEQQQQAAVSNTEPPPPPTKQPDEPLPSGEGIMSEPFKRMLSIGCILMLYYILAFWMPVYWMAGAANYCQFTCNTYPPSYSGCYESTEPTCDDVCEANCELINDDPALTAQLELKYESRYSASSRDMRLAAWTLIVIGMVFGFIGCIVGIIGVKKNIRICAQIASVSIGLGGLMIIIGALIFVASWDIPVSDSPSSLSAHQDGLNAVLALVFMEYAWPSIIAIILAIDVWQPSIFNDENARMLAFSVPFAVFGIMGGVIWAYIVNYDEYGFEFETFEDLYESGGCAAAGYFIFGLMAIAIILIWGQSTGQYINIPIPEKIVRLIIMILICIGGFILCVGYWAFIDAIFDCGYNYISEGIVCENVDMLLLMTSDPIGVGMAASYDIPYQGQFQSYYVGYTLFILFITAVYVYDLGIIGYCKQCKTGENNTGQNQNNQEMNRLKNTPNQ